MFDGSGFYLLDKRVDAVRQLIFLLLFRAPVVKNHPSVSRFATLSRNRCRRTPS